MTEIARASLWLPGTLHPPPTFPQKNSVLEKLARKFLIGKFIFEGTVRRTKYLYLPEEF